jgi:hypothetical protein
VNDVSLAGSTAGASTTAADAAVDEIVAGGGRAVPSLRRRGHRRSWPDAIVASALVKHSAGLDVSLSTTPDPAQ